MSNANPAPAADLNKPGATTPLHLADLPLLEPHVSTGTSNLTAQQAAMGDVASGSYDAIQVGAGDTTLPFEKMRDRRTQLALSQTRLAGTVQTWVARAFVTKADNGELIDPTPGEPSKSLTGAREALAQLDKNIGEKSALHAKANDTLDGVTPDSEGIPRAGKRYASSTDNPHAALRVVHVREWVPITLAFAIEGAVVANNMYAFNRGSIIEAITLAFTALVALTVGPYFAGRALADILARGRATVREIVPLAVVTPFWLGIGLSLASVRVRLDQTHAVDKVEAAQQKAIVTALERGQDLPVFPPIDPNTVFDPTLPTLLWVSILLGMGAVLAVIEARTHNPARTAELELRAALWSLQQKRVLLVERIGAIQSSVALQEDAVRVTEEVYVEELTSVIERGESDMSEYISALIIAAGDPAMLGAIEMRQEAIGLKRSAESTFVQDASVQSPAPQSPAPQAAPALEGER